MRHDLRVEFTPDQGAVTARNRTCGTSLRWGLRRPQYAFVAGSGPSEFQQALSLFKVIKESSESTGSPAPLLLHPTTAAPDPAENGGTGPIPADEAAGIAMSWGLRLAQSCPDARFQVIWSGFDQEVQVIEPGTGLQVDRRRSARMRLDAAIRRGGRTARGTAEISYSPLEPPDTQDFAGSVADLTRRLEARLDSIPAEPGESVLVLAPGIVGSVVHELLGHCLEGDTEGPYSWVRPGTSIGPPELTVLDDPRRGRVPWRIDDEGREARPVLLVQRGEGQRRIHDWRTAVRGGRTPTGHGRRHGFAAPVQPRMGCTFVAAGDDHPEEILRGTPRGIYVRRLESASVDVRSGIATFRVTDADAIEGGAIGHALDRFSVTIEGLAGLSSIDRIGHDLEFDPCIGNCLKDGQPLATSVGGPTIRLRVAEVHN